MGCEALRFVKDLSKQSTRPWQVLKHFWRLRDAAGRAYTTNIGTRGFIGRLCKPSGGSALQFIDAQRSERTEGYWTGMEHSGMSGQNLTTRKYLQPAVAMYQDDTSECRPHVRLPSTRTELCGVFAALTYARLVIAYFHIVLPRTPAFEQW
jgi:hypothetical protein